MNFEILDIENGTSNEIIIRNLNFTNVFEVSLM